MSMNVLTVIEMQVHTHVVLSYWNIKYRFSADDAHMNSCWAASFFFARQVSDNSVEHWRFFKFLFMSTRVEQLAVASTLSS